MQAIIPQLFKVVEVTLTLPYNFLKIPNCLSQSLKYIFFDNYLPNDFTGEITFTSSIVDKTINSQSRN